MEQLDPPACLEHAREEMVSALIALRSADEDEHKAVAKKLIVKALLAIRDHPDRQFDWASMKITTRHLH